MSTKYTLPTEPPTGTHVWTLDGAYSALPGTIGGQEIAQQVWAPCSCAPDKAVDFSHAPNRVSVASCLSWGQLLQAAGQVETFIPGEKVRPTVHAPGETVNLLEALQHSEDKRQEIEKGWLAAVEMAAEANLKIEAYQAHMSTVASFVTRLNEKAPEMTDETLRHNIRVLLNLIEKG